MVYGEHSMRIDHETVIKLKLICIDVLAFISLPISDQSGEIPAQSNWFDHLSLPMQSISYSPV